MKLFSSRSKSVVKSSEDTSIFEENMPEHIVKAPRVSHIDPNRAFKTPWWFVEGCTAVTIGTHFFSVPGIGIVIEPEDIDKGVMLQVPIYPAWDPNLPSECYNERTAQRRGLMYLEYLGSPLFSCKVVRSTEDQVTVQVRGSDLRGALNYYFKNSNVHLHKRLSIYYGSREIWEFNVRPLMGNEPLGSQFQSHLQGRVTLHLRNYYKEVKPGDF